MALALRERPVGLGTGERELVRAVRNGDDRAFEQLFARYRPRISAYVCGLVGDHGRAEDITQEVFISALRRLRETERPIAFRPWIYEIARNACIDEYRRVQRASVISLEQEPAEPRLQVPPMADHASPEDRWERKQQLGHLTGAFSGLSDSHHRVLVLRELEGLSYSEIGERLGMSRPVVESTLFRARRRLTQEYDELASGRRCHDVQAAVDGRTTRALRTLGIRERRRIARHLAHCQDCLRYARLAGVADADLRVSTLAERVAALLPFGWWRLGRGDGRGIVPPQGPNAGVAIGNAAAAVAAAVMLVGAGLPAAGSAPQRPSPRPSPAVAGQGNPTPIAADLKDLRALAAAAAAERRAALSPPRNAHRAANAGRRAATPRGRHGAGSAGTRSTAPAAASPRPGSPALPAAALGQTAAGLVAAGSSALSTVQSRVNSTVSSVASQLPAAAHALTTPLVQAGSVISQAGARAGQVVAPLSQSGGQAATNLTQGVGQAVSQTGQGVGQAGAAAGAGAGAVVVHLVSGLTAGPSTP